MSNITKFLGVFGAAKVESGIKDLTTWLVQLDPKTASEAQLKMLRDKQMEYANRLIDAKRAGDKEEAEAVAAENALDRALKALGVLKSRCDAATDEYAKKPILAQAATVATEVERLQANATRERTEANNAKEVITAVQQLYDLMSKKVEEGSSKITVAGQRLATAKATNEHAKLMDELSGQAKAFAGVDIAFDAMTHAAENAERDTEVLKMTAKQPGSAAADAISAILGETASATPKDPFAALASAPAPAKKAAA